MSQQPEKPENEITEGQGTTYSVESPGAQAESHEPVEVSSPDSAAGEAEGIEIPERLPLLPVRDTCAFPGTIVPLQIRREKSKRVLDMALTGSHLIAVVAQRSLQTDDPDFDDLHHVGTACMILKMLKMPDNTETLIVHGVRRVGIEAITREDEYLEATVRQYADPTEVTMEQKALAHSVRTAAERIIELSPNIPDEARQVLNGIETPGGLADFLAANLSLNLAQKTGAAGDL